MSVARDFVTLFLLGSLCVSAACAPVSGALDQAPAKNASMSGNTKCHVPFESERLHYSICNADAFGIYAGAAEELASILSAEWQRSVADKLARLYRGDPTLGSNIPWSRIKTPEVRSAILASIGQYVRRGDVAISMAEARSASEEYVAANLDQFPFISLRIIGDLDFQGYESKLLQIVRRPKDRLHQVQAIGALAGLCSIEATNALNKLSLEFANDIEVLDEIRGSIGIRDKDWFRIQCSNRPDN
jgi:hypothetical protein